MKSFNINNIYACEVENTSLYSIESGLSNLYSSVRTICPGHVCPILLIVFSYVCHDFPFSFYLVFLLPILPFLVFCICPDFATISFFCDVKSLIVIIGVFSIPAYECYY